MHDYTITLGYVPTRRDTLPDKPAQEVEKGIRKKVDQILEEIGGVTLVDIREVVPEGILWQKDDIEPVIRYLRGKEVDALFIPHANFGQEEAIAKVAQEVGRPVLLWGPRDPAPEGVDAFRPLDIQCGLFATSKVLARYQVPFTYLENCTLEDPVLQRGLDDFIRVAGVVKSMRHMRIGQIGGRPRQFNSMKVNESELLEKFGIEVTPIWPEELFAVVEKLERGRADAVGCPSGMEMLPCPDEGEPRPADPRIAQRVEEMASALDCSRIPREHLQKMMAVEIAIEELARIHHLDGIAMECWTTLQTRYGINACGILGDLFDHGLVAACETDIHAAVTARMLQAACRGRTAPFIADLTCRHPDNDNAELLWHCGPFAKSLRKKGAGASVRYDKGFYEIEGGAFTLARLDQIGGSYQLFADEAAGCEGPQTNGNYVWVETENWPEWEKKFMYGPYVHHICGVHGRYAGILKESCKYLGGIRHDSVNRIEY